MSTLYNITDKEDNVMTIRVGRNFISTDRHAYVWKPITPGKVKAAAGKWHPAHRVGGESASGLACRMKQDDREISVLWLKDFFTAAFFFADSGEGILYEEGVTTLTPGKCTYECIE